MPNTFPDPRVTLSFYRVLAACFGTAACIAALAAVWFYLTHVPHVGDALTALTVPLVGIAGVLRVRAFCSTLNERWAAAFEAGRIVGQEQEREAGHVRSLR